MTYLKRRNARRLAVLAGAVAMLCMLFALTASSASASPFCGGQRENKFETCFGAARVLTGDDGNGTETSICIGINEISGPCSSGPGAIATLNLGSAANRVPWIRGNAERLTIVHGETF